MKLKKHKLLEKAMNDYPEGTVATWDGEPITATGQYYIDINGWVINGDHRPLYDASCDEWAKIISSNKPKELQVKLSDGLTTATVDLHEVTILYPNTIKNFISTYDVEIIYKAYQSLQS